MRDHYAANADTYKARARAATIARRAEIRAYLQGVKSQPCMDCQISHPYYVMQFDHVRGKKLLTLGHATKGYVSLAKVREEVAKCDVVCANCHAVRTFLRMGLESE